MVFQQEVLFLALVLAILDVSYSEEELVNPESRKMVAMENDMMETAESKYKMGAGGGRGKGKMGGGYKKHG